MKCPVCGMEVRQGAQKCEHCGFDDIRYEFINNEERHFWQNYVVKPCQFAYRNVLFQNGQIDELQQKIGELEKRLKNQPQTKVADDTPLIIDKDDRIEPIFVNNGWNYDDPIKRPNSAICKYWSGKVVELTDISTEIIDSTDAIVTFIVKRLSDVEKTDANYVGFTWRVKNEKGIIVHTEQWYDETLTNIGDAKQGTIKFEVGPLTEGLSIDFVDKL